MASGTIQDMAGEAWFGKCLKQDKAAFQELVERYKDMVYRASYGVLRNREDALDVSQDVFLKVYDKLPRLKPDTYFNSWIYRVAVNQAIDVLRKRKRAKEEAFSEYTDPVAPVDEKKNHENRELMEKFYRVLARLDKRHSEVLVLREIEGQDYAGIAKTIGCSMGTVMSRLFYARKKIAKEMREDIREP